MLKESIDNLPTSTNTAISRRDFLKLKGLMLLWFYFIQTLGVNIFADELVKKFDYEILDKLLKLPFSDIVKKELELRVFLQKKYCYDGNGNLHSLNRFLKEITNYIISNENFNDFKLLNSIKDEQIDYTYMLNCTAKHNQVSSLQYLQKKLISLKDNTILIDALEYAIKFQSYQTTLHLMKQKIKLDTKTQDKFLLVLQKDEYDIFYKKISNNKNQMLLPYRKTAMPNKRYLAKKDVRSTFNSEIYYKYEDELYAKVYNATAELFMSYLIDDFTVEFYKKKIDVKVWNNQKVYPINFLKEYEKLLYINGFDINEMNYGQFLEVSDEFENHKKMWVFKQKDGGHRFLFDDEINDFRLELYDLINIEIL